MSHYGLTRGRTGQAHLLHPARRQERARVRHLFLANERRRRCRMAPAAAAATDDVDQIRGDQQVPHGLLHRLERLPHLLLGLGGGRRGGAASWGVFDWIGSVEV